MMWHACIRVKMNRHDYRKNLYSTKCRKYGLVPPVNLVRIKMKNTILLRRSVRSYSPDPVKPCIIESIIRAGMHAPSAMNTQPWEFLVLTRPETREIIAGMSPYSWAASKAPAVILVLANTASEPNEGWLIQGMAACCQNMLLQIVDDGLSGVWLGIYPNQERMESLKTFFQLPENIMPFAAIPVGYPKKIVKLWIGSLLRKFTWNPIEII